MRVKPGGCLLEAAAAARALGGAILAAHQRLIADEAAGVASDSQGFPARRHGEIERLPARVEQALARV